MDMSRLKASKTNPVIHSGRNLTDFQVLSKYHREPVTNIGKGLSREAPIFSNPQHSKLRDNITKSTEEKQIVYDVVETKQPVLVDMEKTTSRALGSIFPEHVDDRSTLEYDPNRNFVLPKNHILVNMKKTSGRDNHFMTKLAKVNSLTNHLDFYNPIGTSLYDKQKVRVDCCISNTLHNSLDWSKIKGRSLTLEQSAENDIMYDKSYKQVDGKYTMDYDLIKSSKRKPGFKYGWLQQNFSENPKHYYDVIQQNTPIGVPSMKKTTSRKEQKNLVHLAKESHDLTYTPQYSQNDTSISSSDLFLNSGRSDDVRNITKTVDSLIARVNYEMKRSGVKNKVRRRSSSTNAGVDHQTRSPKKTAHHQRRSSTIDCSSEQNSILHPSNMSRSTLEHFSSLSSSFVQRRTRGAGTDSYNHNSNQPSLTTSPSKATNSIHIKDFLDS